MTMTMRIFRNARSRAKLLGSMAVLGALVLPASAYAGPDPGGPITDVIVGSPPAAGATTVPTWRGQFTDPTNGVSYGFDFVGSQDPRTSGAGTTTVGAEVIPLNFTFIGNGGQELNGSDIAQATINSPIFQPADYSAFSNNSSEQYEDAVMRSQFDQVGASPFHLKLAPTLLPAQTIDVPANKGYIQTNSLGKPYGCVDVLWLDQQMWQAVGALHVNPATVAIFMTKDVLMYPVFRGNSFPCFIGGFHGIGNPGQGRGAINSATSGQTLMVAAYLSPHTFTQTQVNPQDVLVLSHEISEWADDPFTQNLVQPYQFPDAISGTCSNLLETGDPVINTSYSLPGNTYLQGPGTDGTWHVEDEVFLPWFARQSPNTTSEPEASSGQGRYTFFGDLNTDPGFHAPATAC